MSDEPVTIERRPLGSVAKMVDRLSKDLASNPKAPTDQPVFRKSGEKKTTARVRFSYSPKHDDELELKVAEILEVVGEGEEGWLKGKLNGRIGLFPSNFCEIIPGDGPSLATGDISDSENKDAGAGSHQEIQPKKVRGVGFGINILPDGVKLRSTQQQQSQQHSAASNNNNNTSLPSVAPSSAAAPPVSAFRSTDDKDHHHPPSFAHHPNPLPSGANKDFNGKSSNQEYARVEFNYAAKNDDELSIKVGEIIVVINRECEDPGWWYGEVDGRKGVFPDNFVKIISPSEVPPSKKGAAVITPPAVPTKPVKPGSLQKVTPSSNNITNQSVVSSYSTSTSSTIHHKEDPSGQPHHLGTSSGGGGGPNANFRKELEKKINHRMSHTPSSVGGGGGGGISGSSPTPPSAASNNTANTTTIPINTPASQQHSASPTPAATQLSHPTASRPKQSKRPPSKLFLSERSQESSKTDAIYTKTEESMQQGEPPVSSSNPVPSSYPKTNIHTTLANKGNDVVKGSTTAVSSSNPILPPSILLSSSTRGGDTPSISSTTGSASASAVTNNIHNIHHHSSFSGGMVSMEAFQSLKSEFESYKRDTNRKIEELERRLKKLEK